MASKKRTIIKVRHKTLRKSGGAHKVKKSYDRKRDKRATERRAARGWDL